MKKYLLALFAIVLVSPSIALASWWNPTSWFNKSLLSSQIATSSSTTTIQYVERIVEKPIEKIVEKPVIREVIKTVDNPDQTKKISDLETQISQLQDANSKLKAAYLDAAKGFTTLRESSEKLYDTSKELLVSLRECTAQTRTSYVPVFSLPSIPEPMSNEDVMTILKQACHGAWHSDTGTCYTNY
jgi:hypothetical protein